MKDIQDNRELDDLRIGLSCELAELTLRAFYGHAVGTNGNDHRIYLFDKDGSSKYTEEAQDEFDEIYDYVEHILCQSLNAYQITEKEEVK